MIATRADLLASVHAMTDDELAHQWIIRAHRSSLGNRRWLRAVRVERVLRDCGAGS